MPGDIIPQLQSISQNGSDPELRKLASDFFASVDKKGEILKMVEAYGKTLGDLTPEITRDVLQNLIPFLKEFGEDVLKKVSNEVREKILLSFKDKEKNTRLRSIYNDKSIVDTSKLTTQAKSQYVGAVVNASASRETESIFRSTAAKWKKNVDDLSSVISQFVKNVETYNKKASHFTDYDKEFKKRYEKANVNIPSGWTGGDIAYKRRQIAAQLEEDFHSESKRDIEIANTFQELSDRRGLTRTEKARIANLKKDYDAKELFADRDEFGKGLEKEAKAFGTLARSISVSDRVLLAFDSHVEDLNERFKEFAKGSPLGMNAFMLATAFATKELLGFIGRMSDTIKNMAELDIQAAQVKTTFDSMFGSKQYDAFRDSLALTRREMIEFSHVAIDAYRSSGVEMEKTMMIASNIKEQFGQLDTSKLQEAVSIMSELTDTQVNALMGGGTAMDVSNMYASLAKSRKAGRAADLLEQGVFGGDPLLESLNDRDKELIKLQRQAVKSIEDMSHGIKDMVPGLGILTSVEKHISAIVGIGQQLLTAYAVAGMFTSFGKGNIGKEGGTIRNLFHKFDMLMAHPKMMTAQGGEVAKLLGSGASSLKNLGSAIIPAAVAYSIGEGLQKYFDSRSIAWNAQNQRRAENTYAMTGLVDISNQFAKDTNKISSKALGWAGKGAALGAGIGSIIPGIGTGVGAFTGGVIGGLAGLMSEANTQSYKRERDLGLTRKTQVKTWVNRPDNGLGHVATEDVVELNQELVKALDVNSERTKQLYESMRLTNRERIKSLRAIEATQRILDKISKGQYAPDAEARIAMAKANIEAAQAMGGGTGNYKANVLDILEGNLDRFSTNMQAIDQQLDLWISYRDVEENARLTAIRGILTEQSSETKKFVEEMNESIGQYGKIPTIIARTLQNKINQMQVDFRNRSAGGTSFGTNSLLAENVSNNMKSLGDSLGQAFADYMRAKGANQDLEVKSRDRIQKGLKELGFNESWINNDLFQNGEINSSEIEKGRKAASAMKKNLEEQIENELGISESIKPLFDKMLFNQENLKKKIKEINDLPENELDEDKKKEIYEDVLISARDARRGAQDIVDKFGENSNFGKEALEDVKRLDEYIQNLLGKDYKTSNKNDFAGMFGSVSGFRSSILKYQEEQAKILKEGKYKFQNDELRKTESGLALIQSHTSSDVLNKQMMSNIAQGLIEQASPFLDSLNAIMSQIENDQLLKAINNLIETNSMREGWRAQNNEMTKFLKEDLFNFYEKIDRMNELVPEVEEKINKANQEYNQELIKALNSSDLQDATKENLKQLDEMLQELSQSRVDYAKTGNEESLRLAKAQEKEIKDFIEQNASDLDFKNMATILDTLSGNTDAANYEMEKLKASIDQLAANSLDKLLSGIEKLNSNMTHRMLEQRQSTASAMVGLFGDMNRPDLARAMYGQRLTDARRQYEFDKNQLAEYWETEFNNYRKSGYSTAESEELANQRMLERNVQIEKTFRDKRVEASMDAYNIEKQRLDLIREELDIQADYMSSIGAPFQEILKVEQRRFGLADENYRNARDHYRRLLESGENGVALEKAKNELQRAAAEKMKAAYGAQNSALEKMFGNMIGAFGQIAGIIGPNNLAAKYGMGYMQGQNGTVFRGSTKGPGLMGWQFAASFGEGTMNSELINSNSPIEKIIYANLAETRLTNELLKNINRNVKDIKNDENGPETGKQGKNLIPNTNGISTDSHLKSTKTTFPNADLIRKKQLEQIQLFQQKRQGEKAYLESNFGDVDLMRRALYKFYGRNNIDLSDDSYVKRKFQGAFLNKTRNWNRLLDAYKEAYDSKDFMSNEEGSKIIPNFGYAGWGIEEGGIAKQKKLNPYQEALIRHREAIEGWRQKIRNTSQAYLDEAMKGAIQHQQSLPGNEGMEYHGGLIDRNTPMSPREAMEYQRGAIESIRQYNRNLSQSALDDAYRSSIQHQQSLPGNEGMQYGGGWINRNTPQSPKEAMEYQRGAIESDAQRNRNVKKQYMDQATNQSINRLNSTRQNTTSQIKVSVNPVEMKPATVTIHLDKDEVIRLVQKEAPGAVSQEIKNA